MAEIAEHEWKAFHNNNDVLVISIFSNACHLLFFIAVIYILFLFNWYYMIELWFCLSIFIDNICN